MTPPPARALRRASAAVLALALTLLGGILLLSEAPPAAAAAPVIDYPLGGSTVPGSSFTASGTSDEPFDITIRMNAGVTDICTIPSSVGTWDWDCEITGLSGGPQTLRVIQNGFEYTVSFTLEGAPLVLEFPLDGGIVYGSLDTARGTADAGDSLFVEIDGGAWCAEGPPVSPGDAWSCSGPVITAPGVHTFFVMQGVKDLSGSFELHSALPLPTIDSSGGLVERDADALAGGLTVTGTGTYYGEEPVAVTVDLFANPHTPGDPSIQSCATTPASDGTWMCTFATVPPDGGYTLGVSQSLSTTGPTDGGVVALSVDSTVPPPPPPPAPTPAPTPTTPVEPAPEPDPAPEAEPEPEPAPSATPAPPAATPVPPVAAPPTVLPEPQRPGWDDPTILGSTLRTIDETKITGAALGTAGGIAAGLILLVVLPSRLLDATVRSNYARLFGWLDPLVTSNTRLREAMARSRGLRWTVTGGMLLLSAVLLGFTDPGFGFNEASVRLTIALAITVAALGLLRGWATGALAKRWWTVDWRYIVRPGGILLLIAGVIVTRLLGLEPGILLGVWLGASLAYFLGVAREAKLVLVTTGLVTALGLAAWVGYSLVTPIATADPGFGILLAQEVLSTLTLKSLATLVVLLLPLTFLDGMTVWDWSRWVWLISFFIVAVIFALVVLPMPQQWSDLHTPPVVLITVFAVFTVLAFAVWAWFKLRPTSPVDEHPTVSRR